ncbi:hypothetical protein COO60DRAFT_1639760 [Scenedesmus sp. NREL 46B-D3]|nr:hypothetical protein COO60DRAFT_1639760 [Scenedesmus sp. NREL 46B-D3]
MHACVRMRGMGVRMWGMGVRMWGMGVRVRDCVRDWVRLGVCDCGCGCVRARARAHNASMNVRAFNSTGAMHETLVGHEHDVSRAAGLVGRGGEYAPQASFGWSNGVVLAFLAK